MSRLRSPGYVRLLLFAAAAGVPISAAAYLFLHLVEAMQGWVYGDLPRALGFPAAPAWWPVPVLLLAGTLVGLTVRFLPGHGGHSPLDGFVAGAAATPVELPGVFAAALAGLSMGAVLGPEAPLITLGGGLALLATRMARRDLAPDASLVIVSAGGFAAISALLGSPLIGAFLLLEASVLGGPMLGVMLLPGLLASGVGALVFVGMGSLTGLGIVTLTMPGLPDFGRPALADFAWALVIGVAAALAGSAVRSAGLRLRPLIERRPVGGTPVVGLAVALLAIGYHAVTGRPFDEVLFSGQEALPSLIQHAGDYSVGALLLLIGAKGIAYGLCLAAFRGGPVFPAMFLGAAGGLLLSHLSGLAPVAGAAMGIAAMSATMLKLPFTSVLLAALLVGPDPALLPLVIVSVVAAVVVSARLGRS